jgi:hypothetical protein
MLGDMTGLSFEDIEKEYEESLGYIKNDVSALCGQNETVNYTVALLVACACEVMATAAVKGMQPKDVFAGLLPDGDWKALAKPLYEALRNGLAHKFDTKHLQVDGKSVQIYFRWTGEHIVEIVSVSSRIGLFIGTRPLGRLLCKKIDEFRDGLQADAAARERFRQAYRCQNTTKCSTVETAAWRRLVSGR